MAAAHFRCNTRTFEKLPFFKRSAKQATDAKHLCHCVYYTIAAHSKASLLGTPEGGLLHSKRVRYGVMTAVLKDISRRLLRRPQMLRICAIAAIIPHSLMIYDDAVPRIIVLFL